jgi:DNA modification methylase
MLSHLLQRYYNTKESHYCTHSFHVYPHKFVPRIVRALIQEYSQRGDTVLDPFCGSGTTLLEAHLLERNAIGLDINPFACLLSSVKTTPLERKRIKKSSDEVALRFSRFPRADGTLRDYCYNIPVFPKREYWFQQCVLDALALLRHYILCIEDGAVRDFCLVAFSSLIKDVSNASPIYNLTKAKRQKKVFKTDVLRLFQQRVYKMITGMNVLWQQETQCSVAIHQRDARTLSQDACGTEHGQDRIITKPVDLIITKIPQRNFDFVRCFKIYFWWLEETQDDPTYITKWMKILEKKVIGSKGMDVRLYGDALYTVFRRMYAVLKPDGYCCMNVTDGSMVAMLAQSVGFSVVQRVQRTIPKKALLFATEDKVEEILVLRKGV